MSTSVTFAVATTDDRVRAQAERAAPLLLRPDMVEVLAQAAALGTHWGRCPATPSEAYAILKLPAAA